MHTWVKSIEVKTGTFGDGNEYSLGCKETKEEKDARLASELSLRKQYVDNLQGDFNRNPQTNGTHVDEQNGDLIVTMPSLKGMNSQQIRTLWEAAWKVIVKSNEEPAMQVFKVSFSGATQCSMESIFLTTAKLIEEDSSS